jgi:NADH-quinone oxidoreductase subunit L
VIGGAAEAQSNLGHLLVLMGVASMIALSGWGLAHYLYSLRPDRPGQWAARAPWLYTTLLNKYYVDELYDVLVVEPVKRLGMACDWFDRTVIDGMVRAVGRFTEVGSAASTAFEKYVIYGFLNIVGYTNHLAARSWRKLQSGMVHHYAAIIVAGLFILLHLILIWWTGGSAPIAVKQSLNVIR